MLRLFALLPLVTPLALAATATAQPQPTRVPDQPGWYDSALKFVPPGYVAGYAVRSDEQKLKGVVPVFPATADDPAKFASTFDRGQVLEIELRRSGDALEAASATLRPREPGETGAPQGTSSSDQARQFIDINRAVETRFKNLPPGTMACNFGAYSIDKDRKGLNVRAEASAQAPILGTLPPPFSFKAKGNNGPEGGWRTEFLVIGYRDGWFLIQGAAPPSGAKRHEEPARPLQSARAGRSLRSPAREPPSGAKRHEELARPLQSARAGRSPQRVEDARKRADGSPAREPQGQEYEDARVYPKNHPRPYAGRGWVAGNKIGANFANGATRMGGLFQAPDADARWQRVTDRHGNEIGADTGPDRILACSGLWALVEKNGIRGWWRHLCSNQVTNCS